MRGSKWASLKISKCAREEDNAARKGGKLSFGPKAQDRPFTTVICQVRPARQLTRRMA